MRARLAATILAICLVPALVSAQRGSGGGQATSARSSTATSTPAASSNRAGVATRSSAPSSTAVRPGAGRVGMAPRQIAQRNWQGGGRAPVSVIGPTPFAPAGQTPLAPTRGFGTSIGNGFGNINHPGGVLPPGMQPLPTISQPLPGTIRSFDGPRRGGRGFHNNSNVVVYPVPVYVGGYGYYGADGTTYPVTPSSPTVVVVPSDQGSGYYEQPPDQYYGPSTFVPQQPAPPDQSNVTTLGPTAPSSSVTDQQAPQNPMTLLVFKDHSIYAATDYWRQADRLYYITNYGAKNSIPLDQLDLDMTVQLNRERNVPLILVERQP